MSLYDFHDFEFSAQSGTLVPSLFLQLSNVESPPIPFSCLYGHRTNSTTEAASDPQMTEGHPLFLLIDLFLCPFPAVLFHLQKMPITSWQSGAFRVCGVATLVAGAKK